MDGVGGSETGRTAYGGDSDEFIAAARRPLLIQRHQDLIADMEATLTDNMIAGASDHARAEELQEQLARPEIEADAKHVVTELGNPAFHGDDDLRAGLSDELCLLRDERELPVADLQLIAIAAYRRVRSLLAEHCGSTPDLACLRGLPAFTLGRLARGEQTDLRALQFALDDQQRPAIVAKHRELVADVESAITDNLVTGTTEHPRLKSMLAELESESEQARIRSTLDSVGRHPRLSQLPLRQALVEELCLLRDRGVEMATLQVHVIGVYRRVRALMRGQHGLIPDLDDLRTLLSARVVRLLEPEPIVFGDPGMAEALVVTERQIAQALADVKEMSRAAGGDRGWDEAGGRPPLPRDLEEPLLALPEEERKRKREQLIGERIRSNFYRSVFLEYFDRDTLGDEEIQAHQTILTWLQGMRETPHLYPYLQGQTTGQKLWRLSRLLHKIVRLNELYQRIGKALAEPHLRERLLPLTTRERLQVLSDERYPALPVDGTFAVTTMLCPFEVFARWIQRRVADSDLVLPPDPT